MSRSYESGSGLAGEFYARTRPQYQIELEKENRELKEQNEILNTRSYSLERTIKALDEHILLMEMKEEKKEEEKKEEEQLERDAVGEYLEVHDCRWDEEQVYDGKTLWDGDCGVFEDC